MGFKAFLGGSQGSEMNDFTKQPAIPSSACAAFPSPGLLASTQEKGKPQANNQPG